MQRWGRIEFDTVNNEIKLNELRNKMSPKVKPLFEKLHEFACESLKLKSATGDWYINYCVDKKIIFFKIEPTPNKDKPNHEKGLYIAVCDEDYPLLEADLREKVLPKPPGDKGHGNWKRQAFIKEDNDLVWAKKLCILIYSLVFKRYYK